MHKLLKLLKNKKTKYGVFAVVLVLLLFVVSSTSGTTRILFVVLTLVFGLVGSYITQMPNISSDNMLYVLLIPLHLVAGSLLSLFYFPNLGTPIKIATLISVGIIAYVFSLMHNIFLVISDREKSFPLYRVAVTWSQILLVVVAIPYFSGVYKIPVNGLVQNLIVGISSFLFSIFVLWVLNFDKGFSIEAGEKVGTSVFIALLIFFAGVSVSFIPTESFLRALFISALLMSALGYIQAHYKNSINNRLIIEYSFISITFLVLLLLFKS